MAIGLALLTVALHARSLGSDFVYDALAQLREDDFVHTPGNLLEVLTLRVMARDVLDFNRPVHLLSLMLDALVWGRRPFGFHLTSVLVHAIGVALLFGLLARWLRREGRAQVVPAAALAALLFAVHPLGTEAVAEPSYREELLVALFLLLALWLAERWDPTAGRRGTAAAAAMVACAFLAVGAKETGVVVTAALAAAWLCHRRGDPPRPWLALCLACAAATGAFVFARFALATEDSAVFRQPARYLGGSLGEALRIQPRIWTLYLQHLLWPRGLSADYTGASIAHLGPVVAGLAVGALVIAQLLAARRSSLMKLSFVLFWGALLPASNLFPMYRPAADRYLYVPMIGVACAAAAGLAWAWARRPRLTLLVSGAALAALAGASIARQGVFASELALWTDTVAKTPSSITAQDNLGWAYLEAGRLDEAERQFARTLQATRGREADAHAGLALTLEAAGRPAEAVQALARAVRLDPVYGDPAALARTLRLGKGQLERLRPLIDRLPK